MLNPGTHMGEGEPFPPIRLGRAEVPWDTVADESRRHIARIEAQHPHLEASVLFQASDGLSIHKEAVEEKIVAGAPFPAEFTGVSFVVSVTNGPLVIEWAANDLSLIEQGFRELEPALADLPPAGARFDRAPLAVDFAMEAEIPAHQVPLPDKLEIVRRDFARALAMAPEALRVAVTYRESQTIELFVSAMRRMRQQLSRITRALHVLIPGREGRPVLARAGRDTMGGFEQAAIREVTWAALRNGLECLPLAEPMPEGEYEVIVDGEWAGLLAHEAFGHGAEGDMIDKNRARAVHYLGRTLGSPLVSLRDSAAEPGRSGSFFFDHEGTLSTSTLILDKGVLMRPITHRSSAASIGVPPSSNGRRQSPLSKVYTRMTNTDFVPGESRFEDLVRAVKYGFYLQMPLGGMEDPKGWGIQCQGSLARQIKDGVFTGKCFGPVCLTGYLPDLLASVRMVSRDYETDGMGYCGKGYKEFVKVTSGGPAMLLRARLS
jgi:TldD protein